MYNLSYLFFLGILIFLGNFNLIKKNENKIMLYFFMFILALICGIRPLKIPDTEIYYTNFKDFNKNIFDIKFSYYEPGFVIVSKIIKNITTNPRVYFGLISIVNFLLIVKAFKLINEKKYLIVGLCLYISYYGIYCNMIVLRLGLAFSVFFLSIAYLKKGEKLKSIILYITSYFFHKSIIFGILIFLIPKKKIKKSYYLFILGIIGIIYYGQLGKYFLEYFINIYIKYFPLENRYMVYLTNLSYNNLEYSFKFLLNYLLVILFIIEEKYDSFYLNIVLLGLVIFSFFSKVLLIERITDIYVLFNILNSIQYIKTIKHNNKKYLFLTGVIILNFIFITRILKIF